MADRIGTAWFHGAPIIFDSVSILSSLYVISYWVI